MSLKQILSGENAFYNQPNYEEVTRQELSSSTPLKPIYTYNTENKVWRVTKDIFSFIIFPIGLYKLIHARLGKEVLPASSSAAWIGPNHSDQADESRKAIQLNGEWKVKRISVEVDGYIVDAMIMGKASTLGNGRWVLLSNGNCDLYEDILRYDAYSFKHILSELDGNIITFNYPGVGSSTGIPNRQAMAKAYRAMLNFLEDQEKGIGAQEIIGYGHSIGGGVQGDALRSHELKQKDVKYVFVKSRTFWDLSTAIADLTNKLLGSVAKVSGWNISSVESSKTLKVPEIIIQTADVSDYTDISEKSEKIKHDRIISAGASLAKKLLEDKQSLLGNKYFMGVPEFHNDNFRDPSHLVGKINEMLKMN